MLDSVLACVSGCVPRVNYTQLTCLKMWCVKISQGQLIDLVPVPGVSPSPLIRVHLMIFKVVSELEIKYYPLFMVRKWWRSIPCSDTVGFYAKLNIRQMCFITLLLWIGNWANSCHVRLFFFCWAQVAQTTRQFPLTCALSAYKLCLAIISLLARVFNICHLSFFLIE